MALFYSILKGIPNIHLLASSPRTWFGRIPWALLFIFASLLATQARAQTTYYSRADGAWNSVSTWSTVGFGDPTNTGTFPGSGDIALIGGVGYTISATTSTGCASLSIGDNSQLLIYNAFTVFGATTVGGGTSGTLSIASGSGAKTFVGLVTINAGGTWNEMVNKRIDFRGGITNNGNFVDGGGEHRFLTNVQTLTGTFVMNWVTIAGTSAALINSNSLTINSSLLGSGTMVQGSNATLNIGGVSTVNNMAASAAGNTVNYTGAGQTVYNINYVNLGLAGSGTKSLQSGTTNISGNLTISGTATVAAVQPLTIGGHLTIGAGSTFTAGAFTHNVGGNWTNNGSFSGAGSSMILTGAAQNITGVPIAVSNLTLNGSATKTLGTGLSISGTLDIANGVVADLNNANTYTATTLILGGAIQGSGTWGSSSSAATNQNDTFFSGTGLITVSTGATTFYSRANGDWNVNTTWSTSGFGGAPAAGTPGPSDFVIVGGGFTVTITTNSFCSVLSFDAGTAVTNTLTIGAGNSLTVSGSITIPQTVTSGSNVLNVGAGSLSGASLDFTASGGGAGHQLTISTGTATITGNITGVGASSTIAFSDAGLLQVGGSMFSSSNGTLNAATGSTVEYNGSSQTIESLSYQNLTLTGSGTKTLAATTGLAGNLTVNAGSNFSIGAGSFTVNGISTVNGTLSLTATPGNKLFVGHVTVNGTWNNIIEDAILRGGLTNNGTFNAGPGVYTFDTNSQSLNGTLSIPNVQVIGIALTNNNSLTVGTSMFGMGTFQQASNATLNINGASSIANLVATANGNVVNFSGGSQSVNSNDYFHLTLSGSGTKTLQAGTTNIAGGLTLTGTVSTTAVRSLTIGGSLTIGVGTTFTGGAFLHNLSGNLVNNGTFNGTGTSLGLAGSSQTISGNSITLSDLQLSGSATKSIDVSTSIGNILAIDNGVVAGLSNSNTYTANVLTLGGVIQSAGTWGSSSSAATNQNDTFFSGTGLVTVAVSGFTYYSRADGDWANVNTWSTTGFGGAPASSTPGVGDFVRIGGGRTVTVSGIETCDALFFDAGTSVTNTLTITNSLTVSGSVTIPQTVTSGSNVLNVGAGTLTANGLDFTASGSGAGHQMSISTGTATISGSITGIGPSSTISFSGAGLLRIGGALFSSSNGTLNTAVGCTVEYNGGVQAVQAFNYRNLTLSGSGNKTLVSSNTISGTLSIGNSSNFIVGAMNITVNGPTVINGTLSITSNTGTKIFAGLVTVNGIWSNTTESVTFNGGITNNGTFTAGTGVYTFSTNSQSLTGVFSIPSVTVAGAAVVLTNNNSLTVNTALAGGGRLTQATNAVLNIGGASSISLLTATAAGNTVNFTGGSQTVNSSNYHHLNLSGSGTKNLQSGTTSVGGNFAISGSTSAAAVTGISVVGNFSIGSGASFTGGNFTHNIGGDWVNNGTFSASTSTIALNGAAQDVSGMGTTTFNNLTTSGSGTKSLSSPVVVGANLNVGLGTTLSVGAVSISVGGTTLVNGTLTFPSSTGTKIFTGLVTVNGTWTSVSASPTFRGGITNSGTFSAGTGTYAFDTNSQALTGVFSIPSVTISAGTVLTNNNSLTVATALSGLGTLTQAAGATLIIGGTSGITGLMATASGNMVEYNGGAQTVKGNSYYHLRLSGTGTKSMQVGTTSITGNFEILGTASTTAVVGLTIAGSVTMGVGTTFSSGAFTHNVGSNWTNNGTFNSDGGTVNFDGSGNQSISGYSSFNNVTINSAGIVSLASNQDLVGSLTLGPTASFDAAGFLTLISSSDTQSASIGEIQSGATFNGNVTVQRFMGAEGPYNRYVSSPVTGAKLSDLISNFSVVNDRAQTYNEPAPGMINNGYVNVAPSATLISGKGYLVKPTGGFENANITWDVTGPFTVGSNQKNVNLNVTFTNNGLSDDGWNLVGNPYPSAIVWDGNPSNWDIQDVEPIVYVPDIANPAYYMSYDYSTGLGVPGLGTLAGGVIALGQAFWVKARGPGLSPNLAIHESAKTSSSGEFYRKRQAENNGMSITLSDGIGKDISWLLVKPDAALGFDSKYDRSKLAGPVLSISLLVDNRQLTNSTLPSLPNEDIPLHVYVSNAGDYQVSFDQLGTFPDFEDLVLIDAVLGISHKVSSGPYTFSTPGEEEASDRFYLTKGPAVFDEIFLNVYPNPVMDQLMVSLNASQDARIFLSDLTGHVLIDQVIERSVRDGESLLTAIFDVRDLQKGLYLVRAQFDGKAITRKIIKN